MKKFYMCMAACCAAFALTACENQIAGNENQNDGLIADLLPSTDMQEVTFNIVNFDKVLTEMGVLADTRASLSGNATNLKVALFKDGSKAYEIAQTSSEENFGTVTQNVKLLDYEIVVVASKVEMTITSPTDIRPTAGKVNDTFYYYGTLTADDLKSGAVEISLKRAVAMFELTTNAKPTNVKKFVLEMTGAGKQLDTTTGLAATTEKITVSFTYDTESRVHCGMLVFLPTASTTVTVVATAYDASDAVVKSFTFNDVQMKPNYRTQYEGSFFNVDGSWTVTIDNIDWEKMTATPIPYGHD